MEVNSLSEKKALIFGITGQDGSYLAEFLIKKGYIVYGVKRRSSSFNTERIDHLYSDPLEKKNQLKLLYGDLTDSNSILNIINKVLPTEIYNLGAQSHVAVSFHNPEYTSNCNALGTLRILESIKSLKLVDKVKFYQASTSELYGLIQEKKQNENTPFYPRSPYAVSKLFAYWITVNYRESYDMFACNGILFNHESPRRGETFVTRKISIGLSRINEGMQDCLYMGNLDALRDWGHARDYVEMQWRMLQHNRPEDFVISTGQQKSVREFIELVANELGWKNNEGKSIIWEGNGINEVGRRANDGKVVIKVDKKYFRPSEVENLLGDASKAHQILNWKPTTSVETLVEEMVRNDLVIAKKESLISKEFNI